MTGLIVLALAAGQPDTPALDALRAEVRDRGWILFCARSAAGDWDLFRMRPDGGGVTPLTSTPEWNEAYPLVSRDGTMLLYRRLPRAETIDGNRHGAQGRLVLACMDGSLAWEAGGDGAYAWASWSPDGRSIACLAGDRVQFVRLDGMEVTATLPAGGMFQQLTWSPDGRWLSGVSNGFRTSWSVARMDASTGEVTPVSQGDCCTPDWFPTGGRLVYSNRRETQRTFGGYGWTELWQAEPDGRDARLVYAEAGRHVYGGHLSPDGRHVLFTGNPEEDGDPGRSGAPMALVRLSDTPMLGGDSEALRRAHPLARSGTVLDLPPGWEPCWTLGEPRPLAEPRPFADHLPADPPAAPAPLIQVRARLVEIPEGVLRQRAHYNHAAVLRYEVVSGGPDAPPPGQALYVAHYNPWKPRRQAADTWVKELGGDLERFTAGAVHDLQLRPRLRRQFQGGVIDEFEQRPEDIDVWWAVRADLVP